MIKLCASLVALCVLAGCSSSGGGGSDPTTPRPSTSTSTSAPPPPPTTSSAPPNEAACADVQTLVFDRIKPTFGSWNPDKSYFDQHVGNQLRSEATKLFSIQAEATGAAATAIGREATALTDLSIAIELRSDDQLGAAANKANSALAALRGTCHF